MDKIIIKGAKEHNLKNVSLEIPRSSLTVISGLSGSGKSSLAFDTLYAEGRRRYVESLSAYARQFLGQSEKPDVDSIEGLSPSIAIDQKTTSANPRSTVGTITEIYDYLRLLYARIGMQHCPKCKTLVGRQSPQEIVDSIMNLPESSRILIVSPIVEDRKGSYSTLVKDLFKQGFSRIRVDGQMLESDLAKEGEMDLARYEQHRVEVVVDRVVIKKSISRRLSESVEAALNLSGGHLEVELLSKGELEDDDIVEKLRYSQHAVCLTCGTSFEDLAPRMFSFNSPYGACSECSGLGVRMEADLERIIGHPSLSIEEGVLLPWNSARGSYYLHVIKSLEAPNNIPVKVPWSKLKASHKKLILEGFTSKPITVKFKGRYGTRRHTVNQFEGLKRWVERKYEESESEGGREYMSRYMTNVVCHSCQGTRLKPEVLAVKIKDLSIADLSLMPIDELYEFFKSIKLTQREAQIADRLLKEVLNRLRFLCEVGLQYLNLHRSSGTLAGGEAQRIRLASQIGSGLTGVLYVLDEPSIGLHQRDNARLIAMLERLRDLDNTVVVVEHDEEILRSADYIVDVGPRAGEHGGEIVVAGDLGEIIKCEASITGQYLRGTKKIDVPKRKAKDPLKYLKLEGVSANNIDSLEVEIPLGLFVAVTGVSGSGKSTLVNTVLLKALARYLNAQANESIRFDHLEKLFISGVIDKIISIDQSPIGRTPRSNPATYSGVFDHIRKLFALTPEARVRGYQPGRFSFNVAGGRCQVCEGDGTIKVEMHFLPDVYVKCEGCGGSRYNRDTLEITYRGYSIADVLNSPIDDALEIFTNHPSIARILQTLVDVGLGYVRLGQSAPTLSGGEAQRVKLASELAKRSTGSTFYVLDEPTTGLHMEDVARLLEVLERLVAAGNTVLVIEHNLDVIKTADWIIDLGPEGGVGGGQVVAQGTPESVAKVKKSYTGNYLKKALAKN